MPVAEAVIPDEVMTIDPIDLDAASLREPDDVRRRRILADPYIDDRLKQLLIDESPQNTADLAQTYGRQASTILDWRKPRMEERHPYPHPRMLPVDPEPLSQVGGRSVPGLSRGRSIEWGLQNGTLYWRRSLGKLVQAPYRPKGGPLRKPRRRAGA